MASKTPYPSLSAELRKALADATPLYAVAGAGDLAVEKLRAVPARVVELRERMEARVVADEVQGRVQARVAALQQEARDLPARATVAAVDLTARANDAYGELAARGKKLVARIGRQRATQETREQATNTVRAAKRAATTARTSVKRTRAATKGAATSARRTAGSAAEAVQDGTDKIG